jgi:hypothetical protein
VKVLGESSSIEEVAATVSHALSAAGITAVLSGAAVLHLTDIQSRSAAEGQDTLYREFRVALARGSA